MQGGRQEREHCHLGLGRAWQPYPARRHHQANQRVGPMHETGRKSTRSDGWLLT